MPQRSPLDPSTAVVAGYVRRSSEMQKDNYSIDAQKRAITDGAKMRGLSSPIFYEDDSFRYPNISTTRLPKEDCSSPSWLRLLPISPICWQNTPAKVRGSVLPRAYTMVIFPLDIALQVLKCHRSTIPIPSQAYG